MKPFPSITVVALSALLAVPITAREAYVSLSRCADSIRSGGTVTPSTARLIFAQRLGVSDFHSLADVDSEDIEALNIYSPPRQVSLLDSEADDSSRRAVVFFLEDVEDPRELTGQPSHASFQIENPPVSSVNVRFLQDIAQQSHERSRPSKQATRCQGTDVNIPAGLKNEKTTTAGCHTILHSKLDKPRAGPVTSSNINTLLNELHSSAEASSAEVIAVFLPPAPSASLFKRSSTPSSWGKYVVPRQAPAPKSSARPSDEPESTGDIEGDTNADELQRPSVDEVSNPSTTARPLKDRPGKGTGDNDDNPDEDDPDSPKRPSKVSASATGSATSSSTPKDTSPPKGILPQCYTSESECNKATHGCSGHGSCKLRFDISHNRDGDEARPGQGVSTKTKCFSCMCEVSSKKTDSGSNKTIKWTGPACQKKDVSTEFWLLGGTTLALVGIVTWAILLLSSMGSQELPSVIGAGVAGLGARGKQ